MISGIEYDIENWVEQSDNPDIKEFREAVHTILKAVATDDDLKANMILKGGILLAIKYNSHRFTKDIDFSTEKTLDQNINEVSIRESLNKSLIQTVEELDYELDCRVQSSKLQPKKPGATFPSIKLKIGYAYKGTPKHRLLMGLRCTSVVSIDYSLNEATSNIDNMTISASDTILSYSTIDLIAEKYRSLLQQVSRNRNRRQDVYDLKILIDNIGDCDKQEILKTLISKSDSRGLSPNSNSINEPELIIRAKKEYYTLEDEIEGTLPDFDTIFENVSDFYMSLPWD